nr:RHS repeat-associated core domain-containing protein [Streptomyces sp. SID4917]
MLDLIGVSWPNVDEDAYREMADALREFAEDLEDDGQLANNHVQRLISSGHGEALDALNGHWGQVKDKHIKDIASAARTIAGALDTAATAIEVMKGAAIVQLGYLAAEAGISLSLIPVTGGLSALVGAGAMRATQEVVRRLIKEAADEAVGYIVSAMTEPAVAALENLAADLVVQLGATAMGLQDGVDLDQAKQAGTDGFKEGVQGSKDAMHLASTRGGGGGGGGGSGAGSSPGSGPGFHIEHSEHDFASTQLNGVSVSIHGRTAGKLTKAKTAHGRTRGRDSIAEVIDPLADKAMDALEKAAKTMGDHVGQTLPQAVRQISKDHKNNDDDIRARLAKERKNDNGAGAGGGPGGPGGSTPGRSRPSGHEKPESLRGAKNDPRRNGIPLNGKTCKNDPVDVATGEMTLPQTDLALPGTLPLVLSRTHLSEYRYGQWFGASWASTLDERIEPDPIGTGGIWARQDGSLLVYPGLPLPGRDPVLPMEGPRLALVHDGQDEDVTTYTVTDPHTGLTRYFSGSPYRASTAYWLTAIEDRNGNRISFARRSDGSPTTVSHDGGYTVQVTTEAERVRALHLRTPDGPVEVMTYGYDARGRLSDVVNSSGLPLRFTYDEPGRVTSWTDRNDYTFTYVYDHAGRVVRTVGPDGFLSSSFAYDTENRITRYTDSTGATTTLHLNELLQVVRETDPLGHSTLRTWDRHDRMLSHTDALGQQTRYSWDEHGDLAAVDLPDGSTVTVRHNGLHQPTAITRSDGSTWQHHYDDRGNLTEIHAPDGAVTRSAYDASGARRTTTDTAGAVHRVTNSPAGLPVAVTDPLGNTTEVVRDPFGRPSALTDATGAVCRLSWTVEGTLARREDHDGATQLWEYDGEGNCLRHTHATGSVTSYEYGPFGQLVARTTPDGVRHEFAYDTELRRTRVTDGRGLSWTYAYDRAGRLLSETDFDGRTLSYGHDPLGQLVSRTNPLGQTLTVDRDALGRIVAKSAPEGTTRYGYNALGRLVRIVSPTSELTVEHDVLGRVVEEVTDGRAVRFSYDEAGRRAGRTTPSGASTHGTYDLAGNRTALDIAGHTVAFTHDRLGRERTRVFGEAAAMPVSITSAWDSAGRLTEQTVAAPDRKLSARAYRYRADHHLTRIEDRLSGAVTTFELDVVGRPLAVTADDWREEYAYDAAGNQTAGSWPDRAPHSGSRGGRAYDGTRLRTAGAVSYTYDAAGRVTERRKKRLSRKPDIWRYTWDSEDRLIACTTPDGTLWTYAYDPLGRRIAKERRTADGGIAERTVFAWDGSRLAEQSDTAAGVTLTWEYDGHRPIAQYERKTLSQDEFDSRFFAIVSDLVGTPTELVDETGKVAWSARSTSWGITAWKPGGSAYTPLRFPGQYEDPETGLRDNFFRHYDPEAGRYVTPDPLGIAPAPNPLTYVHNPYTFCDPLGLTPCPQFKGLGWLTEKMLARPSFRYQRTVTHQDYEQQWILPDGREVHADGGPANGWITEAKWTGGDNMGEWEKSPYNPEHKFYRESKITDQAEKLLALNEGLDGKGVRYMVSNEWGAAHVNEVLARVFPEAVASGKLKAYHVPGNGMSGMSAWL